MTSASFGNRFLKKPDIHNEIWKLMCKLVYRMLFLAQLCKLGAIWRKGQRKDKRAHYSGEKTTPGFNTRFVSNFPCKGQDNQGYACTCS